MTSLLSEKLTLRRLELGRTKIDPQADSVMHVVAVLLHGSGPDRLHWPGDRDVFDPECFTDQYATVALAEGVRVIAAPRAADSGPCRDSSLARARPQRSAWLN